MSDEALRLRLDELAAKVDQQGEQLRYLKRLLDRSPAIKPAREELSAYMRNLREKHKTQEG